MKTKTIISLIILVIILGVFIGLYLYKKQTIKNIDSVTQSNLQQTNRKNFSANTSTETTVSTTTSDNINQSDTKNIVEDYTNTEGKKGLEDDINQNIKKNLINWNITKDQQLLNQSVVLSFDTDSEVVLDAWKDFMGKNSGELIKIVDTSSETIKTKKTVKLIFEWYIDLSGEYNKLSSSKKQEISNQYKQLK